MGVNPLQTTWIERSTVSSRVALLLRSAEVKLLYNRFVQLRLDFLSFFLHVIYSRGSSYPYANAKVRMLSSLFSSSIIVPSDYFQEILFSFNSSSSQLFLIWFDMDVMLNGRRLVLDWSCRGFLSLSVLLHYFIYSLLSPGVLQLQTTKIWLIS